MNAEAKLRSMSNSASANIQHSSYFSIFKEILY